MKSFARNRKKTIENEVMELSSLKVLSAIYAFFIISSIVMPQYFGVHIGVDITCARMGNLLFIAYLLLNRKICAHFLQTTLKCEILIPVCGYLLVAAYTMVYRVDINAFFLVFFELFSLFMLIYGIRYVVGYKRAVKWVTGCAYFLGFYGLVEYVYGRSIFLQFFATVPTAVSNCYRSGHYRIMGPCGHPLGYGLVLLLLIAIACIDLEKKEVYLFKRPVLLIVLMMNVFLTGSRSTLGIAVLEVLLIVLLSNRRNILKALFFCVVAFAAAGIFVLLFYKADIGQYILGQITSVIDQIFDTSFATKFGVEVTRLENSENYRKVLPQIFELDWLNPIMGRGSRGFSGATIDGVHIHSIDNYYILQYIKYAYPGLIFYVSIIVTFLCVLIIDMMKKNSAITKMVFVGVVVYFVNLWWVDALQTLKYVYIVMAIFYAEYLKSNDSKMIRDWK